jgi:DNA-binding transcriptional MerR regulator
MKTNNKAETAENFTHSETLALSGLTNDRLQSYFRQGVMPPTDFPVGPGRGKRRRYGRDQVVILTAARVLIDLGVTPREAFSLASAKPRLNKRGAYAVAAQEQTAAS